MSKMDYQTKLERLQSKIQALEEKVIKCCETCDSFFFSTIFEFNCDGRCPFDGKGHRLKDCCKKWNIEALSEGKK